MAFGDRGSAPVGYPPRMSDSVPHEPDRDTLEQIARASRLSGEQAGLLRLALTDLAEELRLPSADRRLRRRDRLAALDSAAKALRRLGEVVETARPAGAAALRQALGPEMGRLLSSAAYGALLGQPVSPTLSMRERESRAASLRAGPFGMLEDRAVPHRQELARRQGHLLLAALAERLAQTLEAERDAEPADPGGRPADRLRRLALVRVMRLYERLGFRVGSGPNRDFLDFADLCLAAIGLPTTGLGDVAARLVSELKAPRGARA
jgi:hypothetical protein